MRNLSTAPIGAAPQSPLTSANDVRVAIPKPSPDLSAYWRANNESSLATSDVFTRGEVPLTSLPRMDFLQVATTNETTVSQAYEGTVVSAPSPQGDFDARLHDVTDPNNPEEVASFSVADVSESDRRLIVPGAIFYWVIGSEKSRYGQVTRTSRLRFRRLPQWTRRQLRRVDERAKELSRLFGVDR